MPCTRNTGDHLTNMDLPEDFSDDDPDYREDSADEDEEVPKRMARDRAEWVVKNADALSELYGAFRLTGRQLFGNAFWQIGNVTQFSHLVYKYSTPGAA